MTVIYFLVAFVSGIVLGLFYFQMLWFTVSNLPKAKRPYLLSFLSLIARLIVAFIVFFIVIKLGNWQHLIICLIGFIGVRIFFIKKVKRNDSKEE
ncbi:ATP synthase subunit I [candidate division KSB1 bacterium]|nr:ATP synthase subunit I [candidate division KSB1 bacterium]